ncbi:MAG: Uncharacterized protein JWM05_1253 [Acidimicrobiales bacterium]|nr:Uncharacterized protein [Acidimicrobiales bacterium]
MRPSLARPSWTPLDHAADDAFAWVLAPLARIAGVCGALAYNWWLLAIAKPRTLASRDVWFSDLSARGQPHARLLQGTDVAAGLLLVAALLLARRARSGPLDDRWKLLFVFSGAVVVGGFFPLSCASGASRACSRLEQSFSLPGSHYIHIVAGITEFGCGTLAVFRWARADRAAGANPWWSGITAWWVLVFAWPILATSYLSTQDGALIEPAFFVMFTLVLLRELPAPARRAGPVLSAPPSPPW